MPDKKESKCKIVLKILQKMLCLPPH